MPFASRVALKVKINQSDFFLILADEKDGGADDGGDRYEGENEQNGIVWRCIKVSSRGSAACRNNNRSGSIDHEVACSQSGIFIY